MKKTDYQPFAHIPGMTARHPYVGVFLKDERIEITFLRLPLGTFVLSLDGYREELCRRVFEYLALQYSKQIGEEIAKFKQFLDCSDGIYGTHHIMHPCNLEIGFIQLCNDTIEQDVEVTRG